MANANKERIVALVGQALSHHRAGRLDTARQLYEQLLAQQPDHGDALHLYGCLCDDMGQVERAAELLQRAVKRNPAAYPYFYNLGNVLSKLGRLNEAIASYKSALRLKPSYAVASNNLGRTLARQGNLDGAGRAFGDAIRSSKGYADPHFNLAVILQDTGQLDAAIVHYRAAIAIQADYAEAHFKMAGVLASMRRFSEAAQCYRVAASLEPRNSFILTNLGHVLLKLGRQGEALNAFERALAVDPMDAFCQGNLILAAAYMSDDPAGMAANSARWGELHGVVADSDIHPHVNNPDPERPLRIGYVSADFRQHAASHWIEPLLQGHRDRDVAEVFCYYNGTHTDEVTRRMQAYAHHWVAVGALDDVALANRIREDRIDILIDLSGHTHGHRLRTFARRPAPLQVSWFGFPVSTGLKAIQYRLSDRVQDPPGMNDACYTERLVYLPRFYAAFRPHVATPDVGEAPCLRNGYVTFASLNSFAKVQPHTLACWASILSALPGSRLLIQAEGLDEPAMGQAVLDGFLRLGIGNERIALRGWGDIAQFVALGQEVDIALDTFPFNGGVTTCHALWMGLPVVSKSGQSAASRVGRSILSNLGLEDLVATDDTGYRDVAVALGKDIARLTALRASMRERMSMSGILDGSRFACDVEEQFRALWRTWCQDRS